MRKEVPPDVLLWFGSVTSLLLLLQKADANYMIVYVQSGGLGGLLAGTLVMIDVVLNWRKVIRRKLLSFGIWPYHLLLLLLVATGLLAENTTKAVLLEFVSWGYLFSLTMLLTIFEVVCSKRINWDDL